MGNRKGGHGCFIPRDFRPGKKKFVLKGKRNFLRRKGPTEKTAGVGGSLLILKKTPPGKKIKQMGMLLSVAEAEAYSRSAQERSLKEGRPWDSISGGKKRDFSNLRGPCGNAEIAKWFG